MAYADTPLSRTALKNVSHWLLTHLSTFPQWLVRNWPAWTSSPPLPSVMSSALWDFSTTVPSLSSCGLPAPRSFPRWDGSTCVHWDYWSRKKVILFKYTQKYLSNGNSQMTPDLNAHMISVLGHNVRSSGLCWLYLGSGCVISALLSLESV